MTKRYSADKERTKGKEDYSRHKNSRKETAMCETVALHLDMFLKRTMRIETEYIENEISMLARS